MKSVVPDQNTVRRIINGSERTAKRREFLKLDMNTALEMRMAVPGHRSNTQITNGVIPWLQGSETCWEFLIGLQTTGTLLYRHSQKFVTYWKGTWVKRLLRHTHTHKQSLKHIRKTHGSNCCTYSYKSLQTYKKKLGSNCYTDTFISLQRFKNEHELKAKLI